MKRKVVIVTGASAGIGRATAIRLARDYTTLVLVGRKTEELERTSWLIKKATGNETEVLTIAADLRQASSAEKVIDETIQHFGRIDGVVNIAGAVPQIHVLEMTDEQWNDGTEMKLHGARRLTVKAWPYLKESGGSVVFMSGSSAETPKPGFAGVATINAAVCALAKALSELGIADGVQVNSILPGAVMSNRRINMLEKLSAQNGLNIAATKEKFLTDAGIARYGEPEEIGELVAFLLSPMAKWLTGTAIRIDGGEVKGI